MCNPTYPILETESLTIGLIHIYDEHTHELIPREGGILGKDVNDYLDFVHENLQAPYRILINKTNSYAYSFEALQSFRSTKARKQFAVLADGFHKYHAFESAVTVIKDPNYAFFSTKAEALHWLMTFPVEAIS